MVGIVILIIFSLIFIAVGMGLIVSGSQSMKVFIKKSIIGAILIALGITGIVIDNACYTEKDTGYKVIDVEYLKYNDIRITVKKGKETFWLIMDKDEYNGEDTIGISKEDLRKYPNSKERE